jgi:hypothetical protein
VTFHRPSSLDRELREGAYHPNILKIDPELDGLRGDSRMAALVRSARLP